MSLVKCADHRCPSRANCWRFVAPAEAEQTFQDFRRRGGDKCNDYIYVTDQQKRRGKPSVSVFSTV